MWPFKKKSSEHALRLLVDGLSRALGPKLISVILYGSKVTEEYREERSDVNVFILVESLSWDVLERLSAPVKTWLKAGHVIPVFVPQPELQIYATSLPVEFLDMQDHHRLIFGPDPFVGLEVRRTHLRAQCAQELSLKLLKLRQGLLLAEGREKPLREILLLSLPSILTLFRAVLRLETEIPPGNKLDAAKTLAERVGFDSDGLARMWGMHLRRGTDNMKDLAKRYLDSIERVLAYVSKQ